MDGRKRGLACGTEEVMSMRKAVRHRRQVWLGPVLLRESVKKDQMEVLGTEGTKTDHWRASRAEDRRRNDRLVTERNQVRKYGG